MTTFSLPARVLVFLLGSALFAAAYCQAPLFYSNQNQYFLHGLAQAEVGSLDEDWLANTADPTPAFSGLVAVTARHLPWWMFHVYHALLLGAYAAALLSLFAYLVGREMAWQRWPIFVLLFVAAHAGIVRWLSYQWLNFDYPWFLQAGVAGQYLLGAMLQPSVFGVFLVVAVVLFAQERPLLAAMFIALAGTWHSTYLLPGALFISGLLASLLVRRRWQMALAVGSLALVLVLPGVIYALVQFRPSSTEAFAEAQRILVEVRIPHHSRVDLWLDQVAGFQFAGMALSIVLVWRTPLREVLLVPFVLGTLLTWVQAATGSPTLALLFPWRVSAVLMPLATTIVLARLVGLSWLPVENGVARRLAYTGLTLLVGAGVWIQSNRLAFRNDEDELPLLAHVRDHGKRGQVYLLPVKIPDLAGKTRGSLSSDFKPLEEKKTDSKIIPIDLQRFRLHAQAPIYVDFKSIPYRDVEVIEWLERLQRAESLGQELAQGRIPATELRQAGITHLVLPATVRLDSAEVRRTYEDRKYQIYELLSK